jgi:hypothetical protein
VFGRTFVLAGTMLLAGLAACGDSGEQAAGSGLDAALPPIWPAEVTVNSCEDFASVSVGSYVVSSNYWNQATCPGTQCMEVNTATGAFSVTQGPPPCGNEVASYPNILYGCSYGSCSPKTILPMPVSKVSKLSSSWNFSVGGGKDDRYNVSYDIWFCPDDNCGASGFPKGLELMIWLDYKNAKGWKDHVGTVKISGYEWDVWVADMAAGGAVESWKYMNYIIRPSKVTSVTDLDLNAFIQDAMARGLVQSTWYLYAVQAGMEVRSGGMPFTSDKFSVSINGVTPSTDPLPYEGPSCDGGTPSAEGQLAVAGSYVTAGALHGYGNAWTWVGPTSEATACAAPICTIAPGSGAVTCSPAFPPSALCTSGAITADPTYNSVAGVGFNLNQAVAGAAAAGLDGGVASTGIDASMDDPNLDGGTVDAGVDGGVANPIGTITIPTSIAVSVTKAGTMTGNSSLRVQLTDANGVDYCYGGPMTAPIPIGKFNTKCWNNTGDAATPSTQFKRVDIIVPSSAATEQDFAYCLTNVIVQ